jgi:hypothetical protein
MKNILSLLILAAMINAASAISISMGDGQGNEIRESYDLSPEAGLTGSTTLAGGQMSGSREIAGTGEASIEANGLMIAAKGDLDADIEVTDSSLKGQVNGILIDADEGLQSINFHMMDGRVTNLITGPAFTSDGGRAEAYTLFGYRWNIKDPQLKWVLKNDANMAAEGITTSAVQSAISNAANSWDDATNQNLFADSGLVTLNPNVVAEKYNKINTVSWSPFGNAYCLAYARTYYNFKKVDGYNTALDSDLVFNTDYKWRTDRSTIGVDVQSVALHEMGHTLGLGDLYTKPEFKYDTRQVMHYYTVEKRTLGNGDKTGIWKLYG